jgi:putative phosphoesterase
VTTLGDKKFFVQHIVEPNRLEAPLRERLKRIEPDVVVFGHTHEPYCETIGGILFLNPGSVTRPRGGSQPGMVRLTIDNGKITPEFIKL